MAKRVTRLEPRKINGLKQVKRLLADYLYEYQRENIKAEEFKTIIYGCIKYAEICKIEAMIKNPDGTGKMPNININVRSNPSTA